MDSIDLSHGLTGPVLLTILSGVVAAAVRTFLKDRRDAQERAQNILQQCARQAYNSVQNRLKRGDVVEDKAQAGIEALDRFLVLRRGKPSTQEEQENARLIFDAIHGELCPGGTGQPQPPNTPGSA